MRVRWTRAALADLRGFHDWLSTLENAHPDRVILRIRRAVDRMERLGDIGRPSRVDGLRELTVPADPYIVLYRVRRRVIEVLAVYHTSQNREPE